MDGRMAIRWAEAPYEWAHRVGLGPPKRHAIISASDASMPAEFAPAAIQSRRAFAF
jgi:hypothetical protein